MFTAGWGKREILIEPNGLAMFGYGHWTHRAHEKRTPLFARSICIRQDEQDWLIFCCLDLGCVTSAIRLQAIDELKQILGEKFNADQLVLTATHTHSGPGGCAYEVLYNVPTQGFVPEHVDAISRAIVASVTTAITQAKPTQIKATTAQFADEIEVAWNRSISAYNLNTDVKPVTLDETHLALNREMQVLGFYREDKLQAMLSLFGVHATCLGNTLNAHDGDNKGYASADVEERLTKQGILEPVAIFAQASAGDVSPHYHGPKQTKKRKSIKGEKEYLYAKQNGLRQSQLALQSLTQTTTDLSGEVKGCLKYINLSQVLLDAEFAQGQDDIYTSAPCWGASFFAGTPVDGLGAPRPLVFAMTLIADYIKRQRFKKKDPEYLALYRSQGVKNIVLEAQPKLILGQKLNQIPQHIDPLVSEINRQVRNGGIKKSLLVPEILPLQLVQIGQLVLICCPGEITTIACKRLKQTVQQYLNDDSLIIWLVSYCNDYMGYITTYEEYQKQNYEGGHTLYGQWTLGALQTEFKQLAQQFKHEKNQSKKHSAKQLEPTIPPMEELAKRTYHLK